MADVAVAHQVCTNHCPHIGEAGAPANTGHCCICDAWVGDVTTALTNRGAAGSAFTLKPATHGQAYLPATVFFPQLAPIKSHGGHQ